MCRDNTEVRSIMLLEGHARWILERESPEERLAAFETLVSIAFPRPYELEYEPPPMPSDGSRLSPCDKARRDTYNMVHDFIKGRIWEGATEKKKNEKKVAAGKLGAAKKYGRLESSSTCGTETILPPEEGKGTEPMQSVDTPSDNTMPSNLIPQTPYVEEMPRFGNHHYGSSTHVLTLQDAEVVEKWNREIPDAKALLAYLDRNYMYQNRSLVCSEPFCEYAFHQLHDVDHWLSRKNGRPLKDLRYAIHYMALSYNRIAGEIRRAEEEEKRLDTESELALKNTELSKLSNEDFAALDRKRRRMAEKATMEKLMRGEL